MASIFRELIEQALTDFQTALNATVFAAGVEPTVKTSTSSASGGTTVEESAGIITTVISEMVTTMDYTEPFIVGLIIFHLLCFIFVVAPFRKHSIAGYVFFFGLMGMLSQLERINEFAAKHWRLFANSQHFDSHGIFIGVFFALPIMVNNVILLGVWLKESCQLLSQIQAKKMRRQAKSATEKEAVTELSAPARPTTRSSKKLD